MFGKFKMFRKKGGENGCGNKSLPDWVSSSGPWAPIAQECSKYMLGQHVPNPREIAVHFDLSKYDSAGRKTGAAVGWFCFQALQNQQNEIDKLRSELLAVTEQKEKMQSNLRDQTTHLDNVHGKLEEYVIKNVNRNRHRRKQSPLTNTAHIRTMITQESWSGLLEWEGSDIETDEETHARPIVTTKTRREVTQRTRDEAGGIDQAAMGAEAAMTEETRGYTAGELTELGARYRQLSGECLLSWVLRLWDHGADTIILNSREAIGLGSICADPMVRLKMRRARETVANFSLLHLVRDSIAQVYDTPSELIPAVPWENLVDGVQRLREIACLGGISRNSVPNTNDEYAVVEDWRGPDAALFTAMMKNKLIEGAPPSYKAPLFTMFSALMGNSTTVYTACNLISQLGALEKPKVPKNRIAERVNQKDTKFNDTRVKKTRKELFFDLLASGVPKQDIHGAATSELFKRWLDLKKKGKLQRAQHKRVATSDVEGWEEGGGTQEGGTYCKVPTMTAPPPKPTPCTTKVKWTSPYKEVTKLLDPWRMSEPQ